MTRGKRVGRVKRKNFYLLRALGEESRIVNMESTVLKEGGWGYDIRT